jgi:hypothetical protein
MMEEISSSETSVLKRATRRNILGDTILHSVFSSAVQKRMSVKLGPIQILREEHRLRAFENRVLRRIVGRKRDKVAGG